MPDHSFDVVSQVDLQEVRNAFSQAEKEIGTRYDLKRVCLPGQLALVGSLQGQRADAGAAADVEHLPGDEARVPVGEEQHRAGDVVGLA